MREATRGVTIFVFTTVRLEWSSFAMFRNRTRGNDCPRPRGNSRTAERGDHNSPSGITTTSIADRHSRRHFRDKGESVPFVFVA